MGRLRWQIKYGEPVWARKGDLGKNPETGAAGKGLGPDFSFTSHGDSTKIDFIHRRTSGDEIYFVSNVRDECEIVEGIFRVKDKIPEIWDPENGTIQKVAIYDVNDEETRIPLKLLPHGSVFVVFREQDEHPHVVSATLDKKQIFPVSGLDQESEMFAELQNDGTKIRLVAREEGQYEFADNEGNKNTIEIRDIPAAVDITGDWQLDFPSGWGAPDKIIIPELMSWSASDEKGVKYFSGIATYTKKFDIPGEYINDELIISIDLGKVREVVEIYLNGENMGILWKPPYKKDITRAARAGENTLTLEVANTWSNRLTGDGMLPEGERYTKTNITGPDLQNNTLWKDAPLLESGLLGPVAIQFARNIVINHY